MFFVFKLGFLLGLSIIISIGAQNLFVIKQGLRNEYPYLSALTCFICDTLLILIGVMGISTLIMGLPFLKDALLGFGVVFLGYYGSLALKRAINPQQVKANLTKLDDAANNKMTVKKLIFLAITFSLINPQAFLDTAVIIGGNASHYETTLRYSFVLGSIMASFIWFFGIATATSLFGKRLVNVKFWCGLEYLSGFVMLAFAAKFALQIFQS